MTVSHKADKILEDLSAQFKLPFGKHWLDVYIWKSERGLMDNVKHNGRDFTGCYLGLGDGHKKGLFGEIHLILGEIGAGYVAHELEHFIHDYCAEFVPTINTKRRQEKVAYMMSDMTTLFWRNFYEYYQVGKDGTMVCPRC